MIWKEMGQEEKEEREGTWDRVVSYRVWKGDGA